MDQQPGMICVFQDITIQQRQNISSQINSSCENFNSPFVFRLSFLPVVSSIENQTKASVR